MNLCSLLEKECSNFRVRLTSPANLPIFRSALDVFCNERHKAENVLIDELENDIEAKEAFISK